MSSSHPLHEPQYRVITGLAQQIYLRGDAQAKEDLLLAVGEVFSAWWKREKLRRSAARAQAAARPKAAPKGWSVHGGGKAGAR